MTAEYVVRSSISIVGTTVSRELAKRTTQFELSIKLSSSRFNSLVDLSP